MRSLRCFRLLLAGLREQSNAWRAFLAKLKGQSFTPEHSYLYVKTYEDWQKAFDILNGEPAVAVDLEANSLHYYPESICLLQFGCPGYNFIVDPAALGDGELLREFFKNEKVEKIFHSCDYDMRSLSRDYQAEVKNLFDTAVAAQFLGSSHMGLGAVVNEYIGVDIVKDKKLQQMNWGERPLPDAALRYAVNDVAYLIRLAKKQKQLLKKAGRLSWAEEESARMAKVRFKEPLPEAMAFSIIKGWHALTPKELGLFREIFALRERIALRRHRPPFKVLGSQTMLYLAKHPDADLSRVTGIGPAFLRHNGQEMRALLRRAGSIPPLVVVDFKKEQPIWRRAAMDRMSRLKEWRAKKAEELHLEPALIWPSSGLERLSLRPDKRQAEFTDPQEDVRAWQQKEFAAELAALPLWNTGKRNQ